MLPQRLDILIAFKSISLAPDLSVTEKRVASAVIDHFNQKTTQCDPSLDTLAVLLGIHRRTVIRAINNLVGLKYFRRVRHGGNFHRNFYEPLWPRFREVEAEWQRRRYEHSQRFREAKLSLWKGQLVHPAGGKDVTQTSPINISNEILSNGSVRDDPQGQSASNGSQRLTRKEQCSSILHSNRPMFHVEKRVLVTQPLLLPNGDGIPRCKTDLWRRRRSMAKSSGQSILQCSAQQPRLRSKDMVPASLTSSIN